ncbi:hypothetical protein JCM8208_004338 [Rhodotorula glutinis]
MSRPIVGTGLAGCCAVLSVFGACILGTLGFFFQANVEVLMGNKESPRDGHAVALNCWFASLVYIAFVVFCTCQVGVNRRYARGSVRL